MNQDNPLSQTVHLVDDDESLSFALCRLLRAAGFQTQSYASATEFFVGFEKARRGCLILDIHMPGGWDGLELQQNLISLESNLPIIFLSGCGSISSSVKAMKAGAFDFLTKPTTGKILVATVKAALAKESHTWHINKVRLALLSRLDRLTRTEFEVYRRMVAGLTNQQMCLELGSAERTVKFHRSNVMRKMEASSVAELVRIACQLDNM